MKLIYDISALGTGALEGPRRTGIARVVEELAIALCRRQDIYPKLSAYQSIETYSKSKHFLQAHAELESSRLLPLSRVRGSALAGIHRQIGHTQKAGENASGRTSREGEFLSSYAQRLLNRVSARIDLCRVSEADVLHSPFLPLPRYTRNKPNLRRFITVHDLIPLTHPQYFFGDEHRLVSEVVGSIAPDDFVFTDSESTRADLLDRCRIDPTQVFVNHLAAAEQYAPAKNPSLLGRLREKYGIPDRPYILSLSTLEPRKNIGQTIKCFKSLVQQENIGDLNLVLVGPKGWGYESMLRELAADRLSEKRIVVTGFVDEIELPTLYTHAMMFVYPSWYEGFGLPPLEAMACGVPVITSNTSSLPEVVGAAGVMVDPGDAEALCHAMLEFYRSPSLREEYSARSLKRAAQFSWAKCAARSVEAYRMALIN